MKRLIALAFVAMMLAGCASTGSSSCGARKDKCCGVKSVEVGGETQIRAQCCNR